MEKLLLQAKTTRDYYVLFGMGKDIIPYFAKWQVTQFEEKSEGAMQPLYGKLNVARVDNIIQNNRQALKKTELVKGMPPCVTMLNAAQVEGIAKEMCQAHQSKETAERKYHFLFGRGTDLLPSVAKLRVAKVFLGKLNTTQAERFMEENSQYFDTMASEAEDYYILFVGLDDKIPLTFVGLGKLNGAQQIVAYEEIYRETTRLFRSGFPYVIFVGMRLSWLFDFLAEISKEEVFDEMVFRKAHNDMERSEAYVHVVTHIRNFAKSIGLGGYDLQHNRATTRIRFKNFLKTQILNPEQQRLRDLYVRIAELCKEDDGFGSGIMYGSAVKENTELKKTATDTEITDYLSQIQAANGKSVSGILKACKADIEDSDSSPANVKLVNENSLADKIGKSVAKNLTLHDTLHGIDNKVLALAEQGHAPIEIVDILHPGLSKTDRRKKAKYYSEIINKVKKNTK